MVVAAQKVQDKQKAILEAAIAVFAERGFWNTPTSLISKTAGVADGTLFNYFATKDDLINEVYLTIKKELAGELLAGISAYSSVQDKMRHIWNCYIAWGVRHPERYTVLHQITESFEVAPQVKLQGLEPYIELQAMAEESIASGQFRNYPVDYVGAWIESQANMTIQFIAENPGEQTDYQQIGFDMLWNAVTR